jgi:hypothetical protein
MQTFSLFFPEIKLQCAMQKEKEKLLRWKWEWRRPLNSAAAWNCFAEECTGTHTRTRDIAHKRPWRLRDGHACNLLNKNPIHIKLGSSSWHNNVDRVRDHVSFSRSWPLDDRTFLCFFFSFKLSLHNNILICTNNIYKVLNGLLNRREENTL